MNQIEKLPSLLQKEISRRVFLFVDRESYATCGAKEILQKLLRDYDVFTYFDVSLNPDIKSIQKSIAFFRTFQPDIVVAVGGGSVIDTAKAVNVLNVQEGDPLDYVIGKKVIARAGKPLIAIPTTAGSGSEATHFAVVYVEKTKFSLAYPSLLPTYSIVDPQFTFSMPPRLTAVTGMDALAQAIESYWSINSTEESKKYSREAIPLILKNLSMAVNVPTKDSRIAMSTAAHLAGKAINISQTTACHAISYPLTAYFSIPHGHAVALTLPQIFVFSSNADLYRILGVQDARTGKVVIENLMNEIHLETRLSKLGVRESDIDGIVNGCNMQRMRNNPRIMQGKDVKSLLLSIL